MSKENSFLKNELNTLKDAELFFKTKLSEIYSERESENLFALAAEDLLGEKFRSFKLYREEKLSLAQSGKLVSFTEKLLTGTPVQHVLGYTWFDDMKLLTPPGALIPRPETEEMVYWIRESYKKRGTSPKRAFDIGTGTGCIALSVKKSFPNCEVKAIDKSTEALKIANSNAKNLQLEITFEECDVLASSPGSLIPENTDLIVSNPPYIPESEYTFMNKRVTEHDPSQALFVPDKNPLVFYEKIILAATQSKLAPGAEIWLECHESFTHEVAHLALQSGFKASEIITDLQGKKRFVKISAGV